jgi:hypothetical protein
MGAPRTLNTSYVSVIRHTDKMIVGWLRLHDDAPFHARLPTSDFRLLSNYPSLHAAIADICRDCPPDYVAAGLIANIDGLLLRPIIDVNGQMFCIRCDAQGNVPLDATLQLYSDKTYIGEIRRNQKSWSAIRAGTTERAATPEGAIGIFVDRHCPPRSGHEAIALAANRDTILGDINARWIARSARLPPPARSPSSPLDVTVGSGDVEITRPSDGAVHGKIRLALNDARWRAIASRYSTRRRGGGMGGEVPFDRMADAIDWVAENPIPDYSGDPELLVTSTHAWRRLDRIGVFAVLMPVSPDRPHDATLAHWNVIEIVQQDAPTSTIVRITNTGAGFTIDTSMCNRLARRYKTPEKAARHAAENIDPCFASAGPAAIAALTAKILGLLPAPIGVLKATPRDVNGSLIGYRRATW